MAVKRTRRTAHAPDELLCPFKLRAPTWYLESHTPWLLKTVSESLLQKFPPELLERIFSDMTHADLRNACKASKLITTVAGPFLFSRFIADLETLAARRGCACSGSQSW